MLCHRKEKKIKSLVNKQYIKVGVILDLLIEIEEGTEGAKKTCLSKSIKTIRKELCSISLILNSEEHEKEKNSQAEVCGLNRDY